MKRFAWSGAAVVFALVLSLGLMAQSASAASVTTLGAVTPLMTTNAANGINAGTVMTTQPIVTTAAAAEIAAGTTIVVTAPANWQFSAQGTATGSATATLMGAGAVGTLATNGSTITYVTTAANGAAETITWAGLAVRPLIESAATGNITIQIGSGAAVTLGTITRGASFTLPYVLTLTAPVPSVPADGSSSTTITATLADSAGNPVRNTPLNWSVSLGILGTGTSKTALSVTSAATPSVTTQTYRGGGGQVATDTIIASNSTLGVVGTLAMPLTTPSGSTAAKIEFVGPATLAVAATVSNSTPNYQSPTFGTNVAVKITDAAGLGVNSQTVLISADKGTLTAGFNAACSNAKSVSGATTTAAPSVGATAAAGVIQLTYCALQTDAAGKATLTAQNISTTMANATTSLSMAGRPAKVEATATGNAINAKITDAGGNAVADGTPVRFTISANAGAVSVAGGCTTTTNGQASAVVALVAASGTVLVSTDWNETGGPASCAAGVPAAGSFNAAGVGAGTQQIAASVTVPGGTATGGTGGTTTPSAGTISSGSIPAAGGFGLIVYGGPIASLVTASGCPAASAAFWATIAGNFVTYVPGTTITAVNADFMAAFPSGIPAGTPLIGKCK